MSRKTDADNKNVSHSLIAELYQGTAHITITSAASGKTIEIPLPQVKKSATETEKAAAVTASFVNLLFSDLETARKQKRKTEQAKGIARAKAAGQRFGRPRKELPETYYEAAELCRAGKISITEGAERSGMTYWAFYYRIRNEFPDEKKDTERN